MEKKDEFIKFRVTKKEKEALKQLADNGNESLSSYILRKSLYEASDLSDLLPPMIDTINFFNEIYHVIQKSGNDQFVSKISLLYQKYIDHKKEAQK